jgi:hypothetical protein
MFGLDPMDALFAATAFIFQIILIVHFALRKWRFDTAIRYGPVVYAFSIPAVLVSMILLRNGMAWYFWISGFFYLAWALFGYIVDYRQKIEWRSPIRWAIFGPYIFLYLATIMFYWFPLRRISDPLFFIYSVLYVLSTALNITSHKNPNKIGQSG